MKNQKQPDAKGRQNNQAQKDTTEQSLWQRVRSSQWFGIAMAAVVVLAVVVIIGLILRGTALEKAPGGNDSQTEDGIYQEADYFAEDGYPVHIKQDGNALSVKLDGSKTPELRWDVTVEPDEVITVESSHEESGGILSLSVQPFDTGYARIHCVRTGTSGGRSYNEADITIEAVVSREINGGLVVSLSNAVQNVSKTGAADSETPYILREDSILFPNGGDWTVTVENTDRAPVSLNGVGVGTADKEPENETDIGEEDENDEDTQPAAEVTALYPMVYNIFTSYENGQPYCNISIDPFVYDELGPENAEKALQNKIILHSDALNVTERLEVVQSEAGGWVLRRCAEQTPEG